VRAAGGGSGTSEGETWRMQWVASTLHTTTEHGVSSITTADAHTSAVSSRLKWRHTAWFKWTRPFRQKTKSGFWACAVAFQLASTNIMMIIIIIIIILIMESIVPSRNIGCLQVLSTPVYRLLRTLVHSSFYPLPWLPIFSSYFSVFLSSCFCEDSKVGQPLALLHPLFLMCDQFI
jgi:predicted small integral membrane protein